MPSARMIQALCNRTTHYIIVVLTSTPGTRCTLSTTDLTRGTQCGSLTCSLAGPTPVASLTQPASQPAIFWILHLSSVVSWSHKIGVDLALGSTNARSVPRSSLSDHGAPCGVSLYGSLCVIPHFAPLPILSASCIRHLYLQLPLSCFHAMQFYCILLASC